ncbi:MAG: hypothetical protein PWQ38_579 [Proteiniphilum sp.]|jgi:hypothetical protein|nr:hypothetical protein [Proteiniphilum sp.]
MHPISKVMEKKYKADNGQANLYWGIAAIILLGVIIYRFMHDESIWNYIIYFGFVILFMMSTTIKEYTITTLNFLEIHYVLKLFAKKRRIPIGDMVGLKKIRKNQLRIDKVRGYEVLLVNASDIDALMAELKERNPRIIIAGEKDE